MLILVSHPLLPDLPSSVVPLLSPCPPRSRSETPASIAQGHALSKLANLEELDLAIHFGRRGTQFANPGFNAALVASIGSLARLRALRVSGLWFSREAHLGHLLGGGTQLQRLMLRRLSCKDAGADAEAIDFGFR